jgi:hypothetical protein
MEFQKLSLNVRNQNIENISVVLNTLDTINFPYVSRLCKMDMDRFKLINLIQRDFGGKVITKDEVYNFLIAFEKNI